MEPTDNTPSQEPSAERLKEKASRDAAQAKRAAAEKADEATQKAKAQADTQTTRGGEAIDEMGSVIDAAAAKLSEQDREGLARYARQVSNGMSQMADTLQNKSVDELAGDARRLARDNPNAFLLGSIALGFGLSRFVKATESRESGAGGGAQPTAGRTAPGASQGAGAEPGGRSSHEAAIAPDVTRARATGTQEPASPNPGSPTSGTRPGGEI